MTNLTQQLQEAQDDQKSKSLDLREQALEKRERLLDDTERIATLDILDKQIAIKEDIKQNLDSKIEQLQTDYRRQTEESKERNELLEQAHTKQQNVFNTLVIKSERSNTAIVVAQKDLVRIGTEIKSQQQYLKDSQQTVDDTVAEWNAQLTGFQQEADNIKLSKNSLSADLIRLEQEKQILAENITEYEQKLSQLEEIYQGKKTNLKSSLQSIKDQIVTQQNELTDLNAKLQIRSDVMDTKEKAILLKEAAIRKKELDLSFREQRINTQLDLV